MREWIISFQQIPLIKKNSVINNITIPNSDTKISFTELNIVKGMLLNVQKQHGVKLSSPQKSLMRLYFH